MLFPVRRALLAAIAAGGLLAAGAGVLLPVAGAAPAGPVAVVRKAMVDRAVREAAPALAAWIAGTRDALAVGGAPPSAMMQALLSGYFPPELLARVRYRVGWPAGTWGAVFRLTNARAITIDRVIVFRDREVASDPVIWAHELAHVRQFETWGVASFAARYLRDRAAIEEEAWEVATAYKMWAISAGRL